MVKVTVTKIEWDFDDTPGLSQLGYDLPRVPFDIEVEEDKNGECLQVADAISDEYGYCVKECVYEIV